MALLFVNNKKNLYLIDTSNNKTLGVYRFDNEYKFSVEFIHSVNKSPVIDYYEYKNNNIYVTKTIYYNFGAGVETELENNEKLSYGENGEMIISDIDKIINPLIYVVGSVYDHILYINNDKIILNNLYGKNKHIKFEIK